MSEITDPRIETLTDRHIGRTDELETEADVIRQALEVYDAIENRDKMYEAAIIDR